MSNQGTPKTLEEAIAFALMVGPLSDCQERLYYQIRDFLAQRFGVAYLQTSGEELERLQELFENITRKVQR